MRVICIKHVPIAGDWFLHFYSHRFFLGITDDDFISALMKGGPFGRAGELFEIGLFLVGRYIKGIAQLCPEGSVLWRMVYAVFPTKLRAAGTVLLVHAQYALGQGHAQIGSLLVVEFQKNADFEFLAQVIISRMIIMLSTTQQIFLANWHAGGA